MPRTREEQAKERAILDAIQREPAMQAMRLREELAHLHRLITGTGLEVDGRLYPEWDNEPAYRIGLASDGKLNLAVVLSYREAMAYVSGWRKGASYALEQWLENCR